MADDYIGPHLAFDRGIDRVTYARRGETQTLPQRQEGAPSELRGRPQLDELFAQPTFDDALEVAIRPQLGARDLLLPNRFQSALDRTLEILASEVGDDESGAVGSAVPQRKRTLQRAVRLLNTERDLRGLVQMYRSVLYQG